MGIRTHWQSPTRLRPPPAPPRLGLQGRYEIKYCGLHKIRNRVHLLAKQNSYEFIIRLKLKLIVTWLYFLNNQICEAIELILFIYYIILINNKIFLSLEKNTN